MAFQNKTISGAGTVAAPCGAEAFDLVGTSAFNVTYFDYVDAVPIGDAAPAVLVATGYYKFTVYAPRGYAFKPGQLICSVDGACKVSPVRFGN